MAKKKKKPKREPLARRQYDILKCFMEFRRHRPPKPDRPTHGDLCKAMGTHTRAGIYCGHLVPLLDKGFLGRDKPAFAKRGYYITERGIKAFKTSKWRQVDVEAAKSRLIQKRNYNCYRLSQKLEEAKAIRDGKEFCYLSAKRVLCAKAERDRGAEPG